MCTRMLSDRPAWECGTDFEMGFMRLTFLSPFDVIHLMLLWCDFAFQRLRPSDVFFLKFHDLYLIDQMINLFSRPLLETNLYHHLISWIGFCGLSVAAAMGSSSGFRSKFAWTRVRCCSIEPQGQQSLNPTRLSLRCWRCSLRSLWLLHWPSMSWCWCPVSASAGKMLH